MLPTDFFRSYKTMKKEDLEQLLGGPMLNSTMICVRASGGFSLTRVSFETYELWSRDPCVLDV